MKPQLHLLPLTNNTLKLKNNKSNFQSQKLKCSHLATETDSDVTAIELATRTLCQWHLDVWTDELPVGFQTEGQMKKKCTVTFQSLLCTGDRLPSCLWQPVCLLSLCPFLFGKSLQDTEQTRWCIKPVWQLSATASGEWAAREYLLHLPRHGGHRKRQRPCGPSHRASHQGKTDTFATQHSTLNRCTSAAQHGALNCRTQAQKHLISSGYWIRGDCWYLAVQPCLLPGDGRSVLLYLCCFC